MAAPDEENGHAPGQQPQNGIQKAKNTHNYWTKKGALIAYVGLFVTTFVIYLEIYSTGIYIAYATSDFYSHSLLAAAGIVQNIADVAAYPITAKLSDVFGRAEGITLSVLFLSLSNVLAAAAQNIETYVASNILEAAGNAGFTIMQQVFIADTTRLVNRGIWSSLVDAVAVIPALYIGSIVGESTLENLTWRWGYGMWCIIMPVASVPLVAILFYYQGRNEDGERSRRYCVGGAPNFRALPQRTYNLLWHELDLAGAVLLTAGLALTFIPLSTTGAYNVQGWGNPSTIAMIVIGPVLLIAFAVWDARFARHPFIPLSAMREPSIVASYALALVDWVGFAILATFLFSFLQVAGGLSPAEASRINNANRVTFHVASVFVGLLMRWTKRSTWFIWAGVVLAVLGQGLMIYMVNVGGTGVSSQAAIITAQVIGGIGRGMFSTSSQVLCQALVSQQDVAVVTGVFLAMMSIGSAIGRSIAGVIWNDHLPRQLAANLPAEAQADLPAIFASFVTAMEYPPGSPVREAINTAYRETTRIQAIAATAVMALMMLVMYFIKNVDLEAADAERQMQLEGDVNEDKLAEEPGPDAMEIPDAPQATAQGNQAKAG